MSEREKEIIRIKYQHSKRELNIKTHKMFKVSKDGIGWIDIFDKKIMLASCYSGCVTVWIIDEENQEKEKIKSF